MANHWSFSVTIYPAIALSIRRSLFKGHILNRNIVKILNSGLCYKGLSLYTKRRHGLFVVYIEHTRGFLLLWLDRKRKHDPEANEAVMRRRDKKVYPSASSASVILYKCVIVMIYTIGPTYNPKHGFDKKKVQPDWTLNYERYIYKLQKNTYFKMICWALLKGRWYTGKKIRQNGQNGLCMPSGISKSAQQIILKCIFF